MSDRTPTPAHRAEHLAFRAFAGLGGLLGARVAARLGAALGRLAYRPLGVRRRVVESHLRLAFPARDEAWIRAVAAAAYAHLGREAMAMLRLSATSRAEVLARTEVDGLDALRAALAEGRGVVMVSGHIGNWEIGGAALAARDVPIDVIAQRQSNPLFDRTIVAARERLGMRVIERGRAPKQALRALREGRAVAFIADQDARRAGVFVSFFGRPASTHRGPALMALRTGAPVFLGVVLREPDGRHRLRLEPIEADRAGETEAAVERLTAAFTARLEAAVRAAPEQYFWHHRRWKTRPPEEPGLAEAGITVSDPVRPEAAPTNVSQRPEPT